MTFFGTDDRAHPSREELLSVAQGNLEPNVAALEQHLRSCARCFAAARAVQLKVHEQRPPEMADLS